MLNTMFELAAMGYVVTDAFADGMVRMAKPVNPSWGATRMAVIWLQPDGRQSNFIERTDKPMWRPDGRYMLTREERMAHFRTGLTGYCPDSEDFTDMRHGPVDQYDY